MTGARDLAAAVSRTRRAWARLAPHLGVSRRQLVGLGLASVAAGLVEAALLAVIAAVATALSRADSAVDVVLGPVAVDTSVGVMLGIGLALALARAALHSLTAYLPSVMSANAMANLRQQLFDAFTDTSWPVQAAQRDGHFQALMQHVGQASLATVSLGTGLAAAFMFLAMLGSAVALSWSTALFLIVLSSSLFVAMRPLTRRTREHAAQLTDEITEYSKGVQEVVRLAEETQVFGASAPYRRGFHDLVDQVRGPLFRARFTARLVPVLYQSLALLILIVALGVVWQTGVGELASLTAVVLILLRSLAYGQELQTAIARIAELAPFLDRLRDGIDHYRSHPRQDGDRPMPPFRRLAMRHVGYAYGDGETVLADIGFEVSAGEAIGVVGPSGAGKSTLVQLLLRLRDPRSGALCVDGLDVRRIRRDDWQRAVAYVPQSPQLMWGTVADNIRFHRTDLSDEDVERAARLAHVHDEIVRWPDGYDTVIGERAAAVSGGQRQRLCLARALAARPAVLILDEPTSALDVHSERAIQDSLRSLRGDTTVFMVAHRLSTLSICDRVMVVIDGRLDAFDAPERLHLDNDFYRRSLELSRTQSEVAR